MSTTRRPNKKFGRNAVDYLTCAQCFGLYRSTTLRIHWNKCTNNSLKGERIVKQLGRTVEGRSHRTASDELTNLVLARMQDDEFSRIIRFDWLIISYGNDLCLNLNTITQNNCIRNYLKNAGKLLIALKSVSSDITDLASMYHVKHCNAVVEAIRVVSRFDVHTKKIGSPGTASALVTLVNNIGDLLVIERMKENDTVEEKNVERFLKVFKKDARLKINKLVRVVKAKARRLYQPDIPTTEDIKVFTDFLDAERDKCFVELSEKFEYKRWLRLAELTLASTLVFNRKRVGEMQNLLLEHFEHRQILSEQCEKSMEFVPDITKETVRSRMVIRGKMEGDVPVLLKHSNDDCLQLLIKHRQDIPKENEYLFAVYTQSGHVKIADACAAIRKLSDKCEATNPKSLRGTKLRKHLASMCSTLDLTYKDITNIAKSMGHSEPVHRNIYRHNPLQQEVVQMTALLEAARGGTTYTIASESHSFKASVPETKKSTSAQNKSIHRNPIANPKKNRSNIPGTGASNLKKPNGSSKLSSSKVQAKVGKNSMN